MGLFSGFKDNLKKSEAAALVETLLERHQANFGLSVPPGQLANQLIDTTWRSAPQIFNGKLSGARPHRASVAAYALACAAHGVREKGTNEEMELALSMCLAQILSKIESSPEDFRFTDIDTKLLGQAQQTLAEVASDPKYDLPV